MKYKVIVADPPWSFAVWSNKASRHVDKHYHTMTKETLDSLPVSSLADNDCLLFLWSTFPVLPRAIETMKSWGFEYSTVAFVWVKTNLKSEGFATGMGYWTRSNAEIVLLGRRSMVPKRLSKSVRQIVMAPRMAHSQKPEEVQDRIEKLVAGPYLELFARRRRQGWDTMGDEIDGRSIEESFGLLGLTKTLKMML